MNKSFWSWIIVGTVALLSALVPGCGLSDLDATSGLPELLSLSVAPVNPSAAPGTTAQFTAAGTFSDNSQRNLTASVTWSSFDTGIAVISNVSGSQGLATAAWSTGSTAITATSGNINGSTTFTISPVVSITVMPSAPPSIAPGTTQQFTASGILADNTVQDLTAWATWNSLHPGIADVSDTADSKGLATAIAAPGTATIQATYGGITGSATLSTSAVASIALTPAAKSISKGTAQQFAASGILEDGTVQDLTVWATWNSSDTGVAVISNISGSEGLATAVAVGFADITATFDMVTSSPATLTVTAAVLVSIAVTPTSQSIALGNTSQFTAAGTFSDATTQDITSSVSWNSSNTSVATISNTPGSNGLATSLRQGTTAITASLSGITSTSVVLTITPAALVSIAVTPASADIVVGATRQFGATGTFTDGSLHNLTTSVTWVSSDSGIAFISNASGSQGLATANYTPGSTDITANVSGITSHTATLTVYYY